MSPIFPLRGRASRLCARSARTDPMLPSPKYPLLTPRPGFPVSSIPPMSRAMAGRVGLFILS